MKGKLSAKFAERYLTSDNYLIRQQWANDFRFIPTDAQIDRGIRDGVIPVALAWIMRKDYVIPRSLVHYILHSGTNDMMEELLNRNDWHPTQEDVEKLIKYPAGVVNAAIVRRKDFILTQELFDFVFTDYDQHDLIGEVLNRPESVLLVKPNQWFIINTLSEEAWPEKSGYKARYFAAKSAMDFCPSAIELSNGSRPRL